MTIQFQGQFRQIPLKYKAELQQELTTIATEKQVHIDLFEEKGTLTIKTPSGAPGYDQVLEHAAIEVDVYKALFALGLREQPGFKASIPAAKNHRSQDLDNIKNN